MVDSIRHFRFPVYSDEEGAKNPKFVSPYKQTETEKLAAVSLEEKQVIDHDLNKQQALHRKDDVKGAIQDNIDYDLIRERVTQQTKQFSTKTPTAFIKQELEESKPENVEKEQKEEQKVIKEKDNIAKTYKSFANEPVESIDEEPNLSNEIEKIPLVKREMQNSREQLESSVPFHRKHKKD